MSPSIWIGWDTRPHEAAAYAACRYTMRKHLTQPLAIHGVILDDLVERGWYTRPTERRDGKIIDILSARADYDGAMSTEHAIARFFTPKLAKSGWALFCDADILWRSNVARLFEQLDGSKAVYCVQHDYAPAATIKMDGQAQTQYPKKNWSSVMAFQCGHPANNALTFDLLNNAPGRDLHAFCWLKDHEIGELDQSWNWLVGHSDPEIEPDAVHFTQGTPTMPGYENVPYADEFRNALREWAT